MDVFGAVISLTGSALWTITLIVEGCLQPRQLKCPCDYAARYTGINMVFVAFPILLFALSEIRMMQAMGALGLTSLLEAICLLAMIGYDQIKGLHSPLCIAAGLCHILVCFNTNLFGGIIAGSILISVTLLFLSLRLTLFRDSSLPPILILLTWIQNLCIIWNRSILIWTPSTDHVDHLWFDIFGFIAMATILTILSVLQIWAKYTNNWIKLCFE